HTLAVFLRCQGMEGMRMLRSAGSKVYLIAGPILILTLFMGSPGWARHSESRPDLPKQAGKYERPTNPSLYVGAETCKTCHEDMPTKGFFKTYEESPHFVTTMDKNKGPEWHGCEACHGPGKAHVEGGGDKSKIFTFKNVSAAEVSARCLDCHQYGEEHS